MLRKILIGFSILLLVLAGASAFLYHKIQPSIRDAEVRAEARQKMLQPRIVKGDGDFERHTFHTGQGLGHVSQIRAGWPADREGADIAVIGSQGADFVDSTGQTEKQVRFKVEQRCPVAVARIDSTGNYGYLTRDESWAVPVTLFDKEGNVSWRSEGTWQGVNDSAPGDLYGDGKLSVVIGFNGRGGLALFDGQGKRLWKKEESNVWHVELLDTTGDGHEEILHSNGKGQLLVRNENGDVTAEYLPGVNVSQFALTRWGEEARPSHILVPISVFREGCCKPEFLILDAHGKRVTEIESPLGNLFTQASAAPIRFSNGAEYFAVLNSDFSSDRSMLLLYGKNGQIRYQEILGEYCPGIAAVPKKDGERLLVGCASKVWEYSPTLSANTSH